MKSNAHSALWAYLNASGALDSGDPEKIKAAKKEFRKKSDTERKRRERSLKHEHVISLDAEENTRILKEALKLGLSPSAAIKNAAFAYFENRYLIPEPTKLYFIEALMKRVLTALEGIAKRDRSWLTGQRDYSEIQSLVKQVYEKVQAEYEKPRPLETAILENVKDSPAFRERILKLLQDAC